MSSYETALKKLGQNIREARQEKGYTQEKLAELCDFDRTYIGFIERGTWNPSFRTLYRISKALECDFEDVVRIEGEC